MPIQCLALLLVLAVNFTEYGQGYTSGLSIRQYLRDIDKLRQHLTDCWSSIQQTVILEAVDQWPVRLTACVRTECGHFEHLH